MNHLGISGRLGNQPERIDTAQGQACARLSLGVTQYLGAGKTMTMWIPVVVWGKRAEALIANCNKGDMIWIEGKIKARTYTTKDGEQRKDIFVEASACEWTPTKTKPLPEEEE